ADGAIGGAGQGSGDEGEVAVGRGLVEGVQEREIAGGVARRCQLGQRLSVAHAQRPVPPHFVEATLVIQRYLAAGAVGRPARGGWEVPRRYGAEFVDADDRRALGWRGVEGDDPRPFGANSGSLLVTHRRVRRQRTPSRRKMQRTWLR